MKILFELDTEKDNVREKFHELRNVERIVSDHLSRIAPREYIAWLGSDVMATS